MQWKILAISLALALTLTIFAGCTGWHEKPKVMFEYCDDYSCYFTAQGPVFGSVYFNCTKADGTSQKVRTLWNVPEGTTDSAVLQNDPKNPYKECMYLSYDEANGQSNPIDDLSRKFSW